MSEVLVIQALRFGDLVQTKRLVQTLALRHHVHLLVGAAMTSLARIVYPQAVVHGVYLHGGALDSTAMSVNRATFGALRALDFERVFNCNSAGLTEAVCRLFPPETVVGHRPWASAPGGSVHSPWVRLQKKLMQRRASDCLNIVDYWANFAENPVPPESVNPPAQGGGRGLGVVLSGSEARRSLPPPLLAELVKIFFGVLDGPQIYLLGSSAEAVVARKLLHCLPPRVRAFTHDLSGKTDWAGLCDALHGLDVLLSPDTGTMHLACHLGVPVRAFFLSSALCHETGPYGQGHLVWQASPPCAPCLEAAPCGHDMQCLHCLEDAQILRSVGQCGHHLASQPELPPFVQLWQSGHDSVGGIFRLYAGTDEVAEERACKRAAVRHFLGCMDAASSIGKYCLNDDTDWMLPPGRYC